MDVLKHYDKVRDSFNKFKQVESKGINIIYNEFKNNKELPIDDIALLINTFRKNGDHNKVIEVFEKASKNPSFNSDVLKEYYIVSLNKTKQYRKAITVALNVIRNGKENGEIYSAIGSAFKSLWNDSGKRELLENSTNAYLQGFLKDFEFYPGINVVYNLLKLKEYDKAMKIARLVDKSLQLAGGLQSKDYWALVTQLELASILNKPQKFISKLLNKIKENAESEEYIKWSLDNMKRMNNGKKKFQLAINGLESILNGTLEVKRTELTDKEMIAQYLFNYNGIAEGSIAGYIGGNVRFGGNLQAHMVTREDINNVVNILRIASKSNKLMNGDFNEFNRFIDNYLRKAFNTKELEDLDSDFHKLFDKVQEKTIKSFGTDDEEAITSLTVDLMIGVGDCRQHAYLKQLFFDVWKRMNINKLMMNAYNNIDDEKEFNNNMRRIDSLLDTQLYVIDTVIKSPIKIKEMYKIIKRDGMRLKDNRLNNVEEHTLNILIKDNKIMLADAFYHNVYNFAYTGKPIATLKEFLKTKVLNAGTIKVLDDKGREVSVPVIIEPTSYSGERHEWLDDNYGGLKLRGIPVDSSEENIRLLLNPLGVNKVAEMLRIPHNL